MVGTNRKNQWIKLGRGLTLAILLSAGFPAGGQAAAKGTERLVRSRAPVEIERGCWEGEESRRGKSGSIRPCGRANPRIVPNRPFF